jgi:hypothetical protein
MPPYDLNIDNRFTTHDVTQAQMDACSDNRAAGSLLASRFAHNCPPSPELTRAINAVDDAVMLANAAIARHPE